jgi:hypothetical protein
MNAPRQDWGAPEPGGVDCGCGGGCGDGPPHMPRGAWERDDDELDGLQPPRRSGPVPDWDPDEQGDDDLVNAKARAAAHFGAWALATDPDVIDLGLPNVSMDVYFSAGPSTRSKPFGCSYRIMEDATYEPVCSLYRVRLTPTRSGKPNVEVWRIKAASNGYRDRFQPALSPDGKKLAYTIRYRDTLESGKRIGPHAIGVKDIDTLEYATVDSVARGEEGRNGGLQHPSWYSDSVLTWTEIGGGTTASESVDGLRWAKVKSGTTVTALTPSSVLGKNAGVESRQALDDGSLQPVVDFADGDRQPVSVANNKDDRVLVLHSKDFEGSYDSGSENGAVPIVVKLPADANSTVYYERFELGVREGRPVRECHHPTWSTDNNVMCHDNTGTERIGVTWREQLLYNKTSPEDTVWTPKDSPDPKSSPTRAFSFTLSALREVFRLAWRYSFSFTDFTPLSVSHKYSQFFENPRYIVTTTMIGDRSDINKSERGFSRVALVDTISSTIVDLTLLIETYEGAKKGTYGAFAPTTGPGAR